jgi:iron complex transport system substrate-binding protein
MILYTGTVDPDGDILAELEKNPIWTSMPALVEGRLHAFPVGTWTFGGPRSTEQVITAYVDVLTEQAESAG